MKKTMNKFLSLALAVCMVSSMVVLPTEAAPANEAKPVAVSAKASDTTVEVNGAVEKSEIATVEVSLGKYNATVSIEKDDLLAAPMEEDAELDMKDPAMQSVSLELDNMLVLNAAGDPVPLTPEEKQQILYMYQQYLEHWKANANILGVQNPFFLSYNDSTDELGVLGEMLAMAGLSVDMVRAGYVSVADITGMIDNFLFGDQLGIKYYGTAVANARDEVIQEIKDSGAQTEAQKLLVLNDWMAHNTTFDMPYIMNNGKDDAEKPMVAENPQKHEHEDKVYADIEAVYTERIEQQFYQGFYDGIVDGLEMAAYKGAIESAYAGVMAEQLLPSETEAAEKAVYDEAYNAVTYKEEYKTTYQVEYDKAYNNKLAEYPEGDETPEEEKTAAATKVAEEAVTKLAAEAAANQAVTDKAEEISATAKKNAEAKAAEEAEAYVVANEKAIEADPYTFIKDEFMGQGAGQETADLVKSEVDAFIADAKENGLDTDEDGTPDTKIEDMATGMMATEKVVDLSEAQDGSYMVTANEAVPIYAAQAAQGLTQGVLDYWEGSQFGALGGGKAVCLGYSKAFLYIMQYMNPAIYGKDGASTDMSVSTNWKEAADLYYKDGKLDVSANYNADLVRITFDASVTMFGETQDNFNSDHYWNAVKLDGKWYYVDPCYTDVYTEVMARDRVETDGDMNHMYFLFSDTTARSLYDGNFKEIKSLYQNVATSTDYEDAWMARAVSNTYSDGTNFYYIYDSTDVIGMMAELEESEGSNEDIDMSAMEEEPEYKLVGHEIAKGESGNADTDYTTYIEFNYLEDEDDEESEVRVRDASGQMVKNEVLTEVFEQHRLEQTVYPSISITTALSGRKLLFNLSNCIFSYNLDDGTVLLEKAYTEVSGTRDKTNPFGGMAFTVSANGELPADNHPIAGLTIKEDGKLYVSIATNYAFISGKTNAADQSSYGYEFEESNYNANYSNYDMGDMGDMGGMLESFGYSEETNDNDEFMWSANFVDTNPSLEGKELTAEAYAEVSTSCGEEHHYIRFDETYYTKDDNGNANTGFCYICAVCGHSVEEPDEPKENANWGDSGTSYKEQKAQYEKEKAEYDEIAANAGHTYTATDADWSDDLSTVTFSKVECTSVCKERRPYVDCLLNNENAAESVLSYTLSEPKTAEATLEGYTGDCEDGGVTAHHVARGKIDGGQYIVVKEQKFEEGVHGYEATVTWTAAEEGSEVPYTAVADIKCVACDNAFEAVEGTITKSANSTKATCTTSGSDIWVATFTGFDEVDSVVEATKEDVVPALGHKWEKTGTLNAKNQVEYDCENECGSVKLAKARRVKGANRYATCFAVANEYKAQAGIEKFENVIIASGKNFADALAGSYLAGVKNAPILLTDGKNVADLESYISENMDANGTVYILGGTGAVAQAVEDGLTAANVKRLSGKSRYETNIAILDEAGVEGADVLVATGTNFADSLSAAATKKPILLVGKSLSNVQKTFLETNKDALSGNLYILGGTGAVSEDIATALAGYGTVERVKGASRYETSVEIAKKFFTDPSSAVFAYAKNFPDGLAGGTLAMAMKAPLILTDSVAKSIDVAKAYVDNGVEAGVILGGAGGASNPLITDDAVRSIFSLGDEIPVPTEWDR